MVRHSFRVSGVGAEVANSMYQLLMAQVLLQASSSQRYWVCSFSRKVFLGARIPVAADTQIRLLKNMYGSTRMKCTGTRVVPKETWNLKAGPSEGE